MVFRISIIIAIALLFVQDVCSEPWCVDLEDSITSLPWVLEGMVIELGDSSLAAVVQDTYFGDCAPGDTLRIEPWEMGSGIISYLEKEETYLLIPDGSGYLQIVGLPREGCWILQGYYDFNDFLTEPGVISPGELRRLCEGDSIPNRTVVAEIRFAGANDCIQVLLRETGEGWISSSEFSLMDSLVLNSRDLSLGGRNIFPYEAEVQFKITAGRGGMQIFQGMIRSNTLGVYRCVIYPTGPMMLSSSSLEEYIEDGGWPQAVSLPISIEYNDLAELGIAEEPIFTFGESGYIHIMGTDELLYVTSFHMTDMHSRPIVGFDEPMTCTDPLYFSFDGLDSEHSGHLGTDIINAMAKGAVTGRVGFDPLDASIEFTLTEVVVSDWFAAI